MVKRKNNRDDNKSKSNKSTPVNDRESENNSGKESTGRKTRSACRRRLDAALDFAEQNFSDENNNAMVENTSNETSLNESGLILQGESGTKKSLKNVKVKGRSRLRTENSKVQGNVNWDDSSAKGASNKLQKGELNVPSTSAGHNKQNFKMTVEANEDDFGDSSSESEQSESSEQEDDQSSEEERVVTVQEEFVQLPNPEAKRTKLDLAEMQEELQNRPDLQAMMMEMLTKTIAASKTGKQTSKRKSGTPIAKIKSPSDTTIYTPGLRKRQIEKLTQPNPPMEATDQTDKLGHIDEYLNSFRLGQYPADTRRDDPQPSTSHGSGMVDRQEEMRRQQDQARHITNEVILEAERHKAAVAPPAGETLNFQNNVLGCVPSVDVNFNDDDTSNYCQVTSHVDKTTQGKVAKGQLVELDKIMPKENVSKVNSNENRLEFVSKEGRTFFVPQYDRESVNNKITGIRSWEKAFRVYAAIYTRANPHRGAEIYQYVHSINLAAASFVWENVAHYDFQFRKIMSDNPQRSWAKIHNQLWSLSMREAKTNDRGSAHGSGAAKTAGRGGDGKEVCWRFNRGQCNKKNCKFEHKCSFCWLNNHPSINCNRRKQHSRDSDSGGAAQPKKTDTNK